MMWECPTCGAQHEDAPIWVRPAQHLGDHRPIFYCSQCDAQICDCCYVKHVQKVHPDLRNPKKPLPKTWLGQDRVRRKF